MNSGRSIKKDYYQVLGVLRSAESAEIDAAYRALARRFHPDMGSSTPETLARLKLINEAYGILSDTHKRREYDGQEAPCSVSGSGTPIRAAGVRPSLSLELPIAPEEAVRGGACQLTITTSIPCGQCQGKPSMREACTICGGRGALRRESHLHIQFPGGLRTGSILRLPAPDADGGELLLKVVVRPCW